MKLYDVDIIKILPFFMRKDNFNAFFADYISALIKNYSLNFDKLSVWNAIDKLNDEECDLFAWELNLDYYNKSDNLSKKQLVLKTGLKSKMTACTKSALQQALETYLGYTGKIKVLEWFDCNLSFNHYYINLINPGKYDLDGILRIVNSSNRASAILDGIKVDIDKSVNTNIGVCVVKSSDITVDMCCESDIIFFTYDGGYVTDGDGNILIEG